MERKLDEYRRKRRADRTPEPFPGSEAVEPRGADDTYVIHEHHARQLHWDVRLERGGVLVSWAVPKGLPPAPGTVRLAVRTEDHPMEYATFSGEIPKGEYGAGSMTIWDSGRYETLKWSDREVSVVFHGERVSGKYVFFRSGEEWQVIRSDPASDPDWAALPERVEPMLAVSGSLPAAERDDDWAYEFKWDGVRALARIEGGRLGLFARSGNDITATYPELRGVGEQLGSTQAWLDGEIVALHGGRPSFKALQARMHAGEQRAKQLAKHQPVTYLIFDLLHLEGHACTVLPYERRRELLEKLELGGSNWQLSPSFTGEGAAVVAAAGEQQLEGVIAKRLASTYQQGQRSADWLKITELRTLDVIVGGWRPGEGKRAGTFGSLMLGAPSAEGLRYVGQVGTGFTEGMLRDLLATLSRSEQDSSPFGNEVPKERAKGARWVAPTLVAEVVFKDWTEEGRLRAPAWRGLRPDLDPAEVPHWEDRGDHT
ncbi:DNA ligase [Prauserella marina]|uniref:DNA ligase (ATP) n=1 Tax=Prauserella marina TaxID=530584 RepID=A0A222VWP4_9PSEU|nr:non-homologous end-joining DNA ligase [Prauserella marina]ASR38310.1 DNA ligase [Prauserella marina]PWV78481.1 bifunctional non-homologous end joining protein LigD [Prauserella marina]SDC86996.1 bifunctional non-homologous end joining protein LigD [Prauserella marina]